MSGNNRRNQNKGVCIRSQENWLFVWPFTHESRKENNKSTKWKVVNSDGDQLICVHTYKRETNHFGGLTKERATDCTVTIRTKKSDELFNGSKCWKNGEVQLRNGRKINKKRWNSSRAPKKVCHKEMVNKFNLSTLHMNF